MLEFWGLMAGALFSRAWASFDDEAAMGPPADRLTTRKRKRGEGICAYCGQLREVTADHVPPRSLFAPPRTADLITVPCCDKCNEGTSKDDEYLRMALALHGEARAHPAMAELLPDIFRRFQRPEGRGFAMKVLQRANFTTVTTPSGVVVPAHEHTVDDQTMTRVVERITRGLYFHHIGEALPAGFRIFTVPDVEMDHELARDIVATIKAGPIHVIGRGEFSYQGTFWGPVDAPEVAGFVMTFYGGASFLTLAVEESLTRGHREGARD
jgi:5-methylcytosine-specific restriction endonuclease McrA